MTNEKDNIVDHEDHAPAATPAPENAVSEKTKQTPGVTERNVGGSSSSVHEESTFSPELTNALAQEYTGIWTKEMLKLLPIVTVGFLNCCMNGFDGSIMSGINAMPAYLHHFGLSNTSGTTGLVFAIYSAGGLVSVPFAGPISDHLGRRFGMLIGSLFIILGTVVVITAPHKSQFIGGRFLLGFGVNIATTAAPAYVIEMAPPQFRGRITSMYNVFYFSGAISATWVMYGTNFMMSNWSWRIPLLLQLVPSSLIVIFCLLIPESPRWHIAHNHRQKALDILIKYHGNGNPNSAVVALEMKEMTEAIELEGSDKRWWDYRELFRTSSARYRLFCVWTVGFLSSFMGNSIASYFLPVMLGKAGITSVNEQLLINAVNTICSACCALCGALLVDRVGRRKLLLTSTTALCVCLTVICAMTAQFADTGKANGVAAKTTIAFIILFGCSFSGGWTPMQVLYPLECLKFTMRAKGMSIYGLFIGVSTFINLYSGAPGIGHLGWKFYIIFIAVDVAVIAIIYTTFPETKGRTLEELDEIFESKYPVKASLMRRTVVVREGEGVKGILDEHD